MSNLSTTDTATHFYGVIYSDVTDKKETREMAVRTIFKKGTAIPCEISENLYTLYRGQNSVKIILTQSMEDTSEPEFVIVVHEGIFKLPKGRPANQPIKATYRYTENSTMEAEFLDINSGRVYMPKGGNTAVTLSRG